MVRVGVGVWLRERVMDLVPGRAGFERIRKKTQKMQCENRTEPAPSPALNFVLAQCAVRGVVRAVVSTRLQQSGHHFRTHSLSL